MRLGHFVFGVAVFFAVGMAGCRGGSEPSEAQMKDGMQYYLDHPPGVTVVEPIKITFFKKEACDDPTPQGYRCTFTVNVSSRNMLAQMYNNLPYGFFYKDKNAGRWVMRPPF
jgi:hypothetical protein